MTIIELRIDKSALDRTVERVELKARELGLRCNRKGFAKDPLGAHWHLSKEEASGTLEATWWPSRERLWLSVHSNRQGDWIEGAITEFEACFT